MNPEILPQKRLNIIEELVRLAPPETSTKEHVDATLDYLEAKQERWTAEQNRRLLKAEKRIRLCAFIRGAASACGVPYDVHRGHFSWCPFEAWMGTDFCSSADYTAPRR